MTGFTLPTVPVDAMTVAATGQDPHERLADLLGGPSITIIGSRAATAYGQQVASDFGAGLARAGATIVTVLTYGIANAAARGALAVGGRVLAIVPAGLSARGAIPSGDAPFAAAVQRDGALVSFVPDEQVRSRTSFRDAHRLAVTIGGALLVPESAAKSISVELAAAAASADVRSGGRQVFAVPGPVTSHASDGPHLLIRTGAANLVTGARDIPTDQLTSVMPVLQQS